MLLFITNLLLLFSSGPEPADVKYVLINPVSKKMVELPAGELKINYDSLFVDCEKLEPEIAASAFLLNADLKQFLRENSQNGLVKQAGGAGCRQRFPAVAATSARVDSLLQAGYKISITFDFEQKLALIKQLDTIAKNVYADAVTEQIKSRLITVNKLLKDQNEPIAKERLTMYGVLTKAFKLAAGKNKLSLDTINTDLATMLLLHAQNKGANVLIPSSIVNVQIKLKFKPGVKKDSYRVVYCSQAEYDLKETGSFRKFNGLDAPYYQAMERFANYVLWASKADSLDPVSDVFQLDLRDKDQAIDLLISK